MSLPNAEIQRRNFWIDTEWLSLGTSNSVTAVGWSFRWAFCFSNRSVKCYGVYSSLTAPTLKLAHLQCQWCPCLQCIAVKNVECNYMSQKLIESCLNKENFPSFLQLQWWMLSLPRKAVVLGTTPTGLKSTSLPTLGKTQHDGIPCQTQRAAESEV